MRSSHIHAHQMTELALLTVEPAELALLPVPDLTMVRNESACTNTMLDPKVGLVYAQR